MSKLIPFRWLPSSWGLRGKPYEIAEAHYLYEGEVLERNLLDIEYPAPAVGEPVSVEREKRKFDIDCRYGHLTETQRATLEIELTYPEGPERAARLLDHQFEAGEITEYEHSKAMIELHVEDDVQKQVALLRLDAEYGHVETLRAEKEIATLSGEPWCGGDVRHDGAGGLVSELEWNDLWIAELRKHGYTGMTDEDVMKQYYAELCWNEIMSHHPDGMDPVMFDNTREALRSNIRNARFRQ